jgi:sugar lactone lactonase YvrE
VYTVEKPEFLIYADALHAEGPCWDHENQLLYYVDIYNGKVHSYDPAANRDSVIDVGQDVGAVVLHNNGELLLALKHGYYAYDLKAKQLKPISDPEKHLPNSRFNDGKCDAGGRFWAGTMDNQFKAGAGNLYVMEPDYTVRTADTNVTISNGLAWSPDNKVMYYIDSPTQQVVAYDYDLAAGTINNKRTVIRIPKEEGLPDGMASDAEGMLWIAYFFGHQVARWNPYTGQKIGTIELPIANATSCVFGGKDLNELYITTSRDGLDEVAIKKQPQAGGIFRLKTEVKGLPSYRFGTASPIKDVNL